LLVEDDKTLRRYLEFTLVQAGYDVIPAADGLEGMKVALSSNVDIVVTDAMMPHLSGHEFCRFLRNTPHLSHIPIVMLSGSEPEQAGANKDLADVFLSKPMSAELLTSCLEELLRRS
jgi:DNA-binding response OmpR family regulator